MYRIDDKRRTVWCVFISRLLPVPTRMIQSINQAICTMSSAVRTIVHERIDWWMTKLVCTNNALFNKNGSTSFNMTTQHDIAVALYTLIWNVFLHTFCPEVWMIERVSLPYFIDGRIKYCLFSIERFIKATENKKLFRSISQRFSFVFSSHLTMSMRTERKLSTRNQTLTGTETFSCTKARQREDEREREWRERNGVDVTPQSLSLLLLLSRAYCTLSSYCRLHVNICSLCVLPVPATDVYCYQFHNSIFRKSKA